MCHIREYRTTLVGRESCGKVERSGWERVAPTMMAKGRQQKARARQAAGCALAKPMAAHGHVNGWREGTA